MSTRRRPAPGQATIKTPAQPAPSPAPAIFPIPPKARATLHALSQQRDQHIQALQIIEAKIGATTATLAELMQVPDGYKIDLYDLDAGIHPAPPDEPTAGATTAQERPPAA